MRTKSALLVGGLLALAACGGGGGAKPAPVSKPAGPVTASGEQVGAAAMNRFKAALDSFISHETANDWSDPVCLELAKQFEATVDEQPNKKFPEATYNAGLAYQRCGKDKEAEARFQKSLADDAGFHNARVQLALYKFKADGNVDAAIGSLEKAVSDSKFENVPALVNLAMFQMMRDGKAIGSNCKTRKDGKELDLEDFECAKLNLQRALAKDDGYMPAFNQLALFYFADAKKKAGGGTKSGKRQVATNAQMARRADVQQLELAALVCSQAIRKNPKYAPIHNTAGLILNELGQINGAVGEFQAAATLDPRFFEAQMNVGNVNLSFRGFDKAQAAFQKALQMRPNDYDAHLGLGLALRGQINDSNYDQQVNAVAGELEACKKIDTNRPDAYFNEGILTQEYKARSGGDNAKVLAAFAQARKLFEDFIAKAQGKSEYDGAVKKSKERLEDIKGMEDFIKSTPPAPPASPAPAAASTDPGGATAPQPGAGTAGTPTPPASPAVPK